MAKLTIEESNMIEMQVSEAERIIEAASLQLMRFKPFYGVMLSSMPVKKATEWCSTMATDGRNLYYHPEFVAGMTEERKKLVLDRLSKTEKDPKKLKESTEFINVFYRRKTARELALILEHECDHVISDHASRGKGFNHELYNIAADHRINTTAVLIHQKGDELGKAWFPAGERTVFDKNAEFGFMAWSYCDFRFKDMYTEQIYEILNKEQDDKEKSKGQGSGSGSGEGDGEEGDQGRKGVDQHMDQNGDPEDSEGDSVEDALGIDRKAKPKQTAEERQYNDGVMRRAIENAVQAAGSGAPEDARRFVEAAGKPKINYLRLLRKTIERLFKDDVSYRRLSRRSHSLTRTLRSSGYLSGRQTIGLPSKNKQKTIRAGVFFDVSGSFNDDLLRPTMREIRGLCNLYDEFEVTMACWSTKVGNIETYTKRNVGEIADYKIKTTFGTDVSCVFEALDEMEDPMDQIIIYTDGYFADVSQKKDWAKKYGKNVLWIILGRGSSFTPPFGKAIDFDKYLK
ncbi:hypothetical protein W70_33 [Escherichia phage W70]|nr:hypothetical protein W70_33 [Escherichia phage W70]